MSVARALPTANADSSGLVISPTRTGPYLEAYTLPMGGGDYMFADEGSLWVVTNATVGTGIAGHAAPVVADTDAKALLHLYNGGKKNIIPVSLFLEVTAAGTAGTIHYTVVYIDNKGATAKTSGGTVAAGGNALSNFGGTATGAVVTFGAVVTAMTSSVKVGCQIVREVIPVVQDTTLIRFGAPTGTAHAGVTTAGTATAHVVQHFPPVCIGPGGNLNIAQIRPSQSAASSYQYQFTYIER